MRAKLFLPALILFSATTFAQTAAPAANAQPAQPTAAQQAQQAQLNQKMASSALQIAQQIDSNKIGEVWDSASSIGKQATTRADFVKQITADRKQMGKLASRTLRGVNYSQSDGKSLPAGIYANVAFATTFGKSKEPVRELISFHLDNDQVWRVTGYTLR